MTTTHLAFAIPAALYVVYRAEVWLHRRDLVREVARHPKTRARKAMEMQR